MEERVEREQVKPGYGDEPPVPYDEAKDPNPFWSADLYDHALPKNKGFLTDMVYTMRGMETPTLFTLWSGLWLLATTVKREAWLGWYPKPLYTNLYVILAGPAGSKKSTTIDDVGVPVVENMQKYMSHPNVRRMKEISIVKDKMTPEAMLDAMLPGNKKGKASFMLVDDNGEVMTDENGRPLRYKATSELGIVLSEMTSSIGKRSYTEGFVEILLDLYNPKERWEWRTKSEGKRVLQRTCLNMLAATTPSAFKDSVPKVAAGDGFLSRCVVVYQAMSNRRFPVPKPVPNAPTIEELSMRVAWIAEHALGEYRLSDRAFEMYSEWYGDHKDFIERNDNEAGLRGRMDLNLLKVATLLRMQRYAVEPVGIVEECDMRDAIELTHVTYGLSAELLGELGDEVRQDADKIARILEKHKQLPRRQLLQKSHMKAEDLNQVLDYLVQLGCIYITLRGKKKTYPSKDGDELYIVTQAHEDELRESAEPEILKRRRENEEEGTAINLPTSSEGEDAESVSDLRDGTGGSESTGYQPRDPAKSAEEGGRGAEESAGSDEDWSQSQSAHG